MEIRIPYKPRTFQLEVHNILENGKRFSIIVAHRGFGKTILSVNHLIKQALLTQDGVFGYVAPYRRQAKEIAWTALKKYTQTIPSIYKNETELQIQLPTGSKIGLYGSDEPDSLRGIHWNGIVVDEVGQIKEETWYEVLLPALTVKKGWAVFIGTPKGRNLFYTLYQTSLKNEDLWNSRMYTVYDTDVYTPEEIETLQKSMSEEVFRQEMLCDFGASCENSFIPDDLVEEAYNRFYPEEEIEKWNKVIGIDIARFGSDASCICIRQGYYLYKPVLFRGKTNESITLAGRIAEAINEHEPIATFIDSGYNPGIIDILRDWGYSVTEVNGSSTPRDSYYLNLRAEMWATMKEWLRKAQLPKMDILRSELTSPTYSFARAGKLKLESKDEMKSRGIPSPNIADALALTFAYPTPLYKHTEVKIFSETSTTKDWDPYDESILKKAFGEV